MNELQRRFFEHLAKIQETCVEVCMIDGYSSFSSDQHDIINTVTGEQLKKYPFIELHDQTEGILKYK